jgi:L-lactate dehydrogenase complex protein LldG
VDAREEILGRVRSALRSGRIPSAPSPPPPAFSLEAAPPEAWRDRFVEELKALSVTVHVEPSEAAVRARVRSLVEGRRVRAWSRAALPYGIGDDLASDALAGAAERRAIAAADVGLTGVDAAVAETGSLVLVSTADQPRSASLVTPHHVAVVRRGEIVPTLGAALSKLRGSIPAASAINVITGPSRTADIELQLTLGVHGPGALVVVVGP